MNENIHQAQSHDLLRSWQSQRHDISHHKDFVLPMFIGNDDDAIEEIEAMPEVYRYGCNRAVEYLEPLVYSFGLRSVLLFPVASKLDKDKLESANRRAAMASDDESDEGDEGAGDVAASTNSSDSRFSPRTSISSSSECSELGACNEVQPERLVNDQELAEDMEGAATSSQNDAAAAASNSQNPFLTGLNDEEKCHLLAADETAGAGTLMAAPVPAVPPRASQKLSRAEPMMRKISKNQDIRLIKGMALKDKHNPVLRLIPRLRDKFPSLLIICDVCLCAFTTTGHCCLFEDHERARHQPPGRSHTGWQQPSGQQHFPISNKSTCQYLALLSVEYARRGCDVVAPSDMMDGRILTIRESLNESGLHHVSILSYSAKFASAFYGPFRQLTENAPQFGDRRAYQLPPGSRALALKAVRRDVSQGADFVMVKPAGPYLDIVRDIREQHPETPVAVYQVSGEYAMLKIAAKAGIVDLKLAVKEVLTAYRRAGATIIISYFTPELLRSELAIGGQLP